MKTIIEMAREAGIRDCTCDGTRGCLEAFAALVRAEAQPEPWCMKMNGCKIKCEDCPDEPPLPVQRPWVGLTDEDITKIDQGLYPTWKDEVQAIEARLKELNNG